MSSLRCLTKHKPTVNAVSVDESKLFMTCGDLPCWMFTLEFLAGHNVHATSFPLELFLMSVLRRHYRRTTFTRLALWIFRDTDGQGRCDYSPRFGRGHIPTTKKRREIIFSALDIPRISRTIWLQYLPTSTHGNEFRMILFSYYWRTARIFLFHLHLFVRAFWYSEATEMHQHKLQLGCWHILLQN